MTLLDGCQFRIAHRNGSRLRHATCAPLRQRTLRAVPSTTGKKLENAFSMIEKLQSGVSTAKRTISTLRELIRALDRRVPQAGRPGERGIARAAEMLRREAVAQIEALNHQGPDDQAHDQELVDAIMTDDGSPSPERDTQASLNP